jgi:hypothetical protein
MAIKVKTVSLSSFILFHLIPIIIVVGGIYLDKNGYFDKIGTSTYYYWLLLFLVCMYYMTTFIISYSANQSPNDNVLPDCTKTY